MTARVSAIIDSFCEAEGTAKVGGRIWRWEFHHFLGPTFVDKNGNSVRLPAENSPVWEAFNAWLWQHYTARNDRRALAAMGKWYRPKEGQV